MSDLTVVIPAYNEEDSLMVLLPELIEFCAEHDFKLIIVNDGSKDGTEDVLEEYRDIDCFMFCTHKVNRGYGGAIKTGIRKQHLCGKQQPHNLRVARDGLNANQN